MRIENQNGEGRPLFKRERFLAIAVIVWVLVIGLWFFDESDAVKLYVAGYHRFTGSPQIMVGKQVVCIGSEFAPMPEFVEKLFNSDQKGRSPSRSLVSGRGGTHYVFLLEKTDSQKIADAIKAKSEEIDTHLGKALTLPASALAQSEQPPAGLVVLPRDREIVLSLNDLADIDAVKSFESCASKQKV